MSMARAAGPDHVRGYDPVRRRFLRGSAVTLALAGCGLLDARALATAAPDPFGAANLADALVLLGAELPPPDSQGRIRLEIPEFVDDGSVVPVSVSTTLAGVSDIYVLAEGNPAPLAVRFGIPEGTEPAVSVRIKMNGSGQIFAVARAGEALYSASRAIKVTTGGCS
jgi:sulfur-oxidizing protein SoxY